MRKEAKISYPLEMYPYWLLGAPVAQWVRRWPTDLVVMS